MDTPQASYSMMTTLMVMLMALLMNMTMGQNHMHHMNSTTTMMPSNATMDHAHHGHHMNGTTATMPSNATMDHGHHGHHMSDSTAMMPPDMNMDHAHHGHHMNGSTTMMPHNMSGHDHHAHHHPTTTTSHGGHGDHSGQGSEGHTGHDGASHTMQMYFHTGISEFILFQGLLTSTEGGMVGACFAMFVLAILYEGLKFFREYLLRRATIRSNVYAPSSMNGADAIAHKQPEVGSRMLSGSHGLQTILHMVQVFVSYCLMLVFMTYNVWLCLSIVLGAGLGYFLFGWRRAMVVDLNEHCH